MRALAAALTLGLLAGCNEPPAPPAKADPGDAKKVALGAKVYAEHCAACHGAKLEGQPNWRERLPNGRMPAPPHNEEGHTWHHTDEVLFGITRNGLKDYAPAGYESDMPAFETVLSDVQIVQVLDYIKSTWPERARKYQEARTKADP